MFHIFVWYFVSKPILVAYKSQTSWKKKIEEGEKNNNVKCKWMENSKQKQDINDNNKNRGWKKNNENTKIKSELGKQNIQHPIIFHIHNEMNVGNGFHSQLQGVSEI